MRAASTTFRFLVKCHSADSFWLPLTTNLDDDGLKYISMIEAKHFPFWGVIFHPEKVSYEERIASDWRSEVRNLKCW